MKVTKQQYEDDIIFAEPIDNCRKYNKWFRKKSTFSIFYSSKLYDRSLPGIIFGDNRKLLKKLFGKPDWYYRGEFYFHVWVKEKDNETYLIFTAKEKGTGIEIVCPKDRDIQSKGKKIIAFVKELYEQMKTTSLQDAER